MTTITLDNRSRTITAGAARFAMAAIIAYQFLLVVLIFLSRVGLKARNTKVSGDEYRPTSLVLPSQPEMREIAMFYQSRIPTSLLMEMT